MTLTADFFKRIFLIGGLHGHRPLPLPCPHNGLKKLSMLRLFCRSKNYQSHDLGLDPLLQGDDEIKEAVQELGSQIDLMMITDYMDESMVLLKVRGTSPVT